MNKKITLLLLFIAGFTLNTFTQNYRIARWYKDYPSATVVTYDDWSPGHPTHGLAEHLRTELPGTFYVTTVNSWRQDDYPNMMNAVTEVGLEIGNHTETHPNLTGLNATQLETEINGVKTYLDNNVSNQSVLTFCYPLGAVNGSVTAKVMENHICARGIYAPPGNRFRYNFASSEIDYFELPTIAVNGGLSLNQFEGWIDNGIENGGLVTFMFHSISGEGVADGWWDEIDISYYRQLMDHLKSREDETWITTVREAVRYHKERNSADLTLLAENEDSLTLELSDTLSSNFIYDHPLSIYLLIGDGETYTGVEQDGETLDFEIVGDSIIFDAIPDGGDIVIQKLNNSSVFSLKPIKSINLFPNPTYNTLNIKMNLNDAIQGEIFNINGQLVKQFSNENQIDISFLDEGVYFVRIRSLEQVYSGSFIKK